MFSCVHVPSNFLRFVILTISNYFKSHFPPSPFYNLDVKLLIGYRNDLKIILPSFHCSSWQFQAISIHFRVFYAVSHGKLGKLNYFKQTVQIIKKNFFFFIRDMYTKQQFQYPINVILKRGKELVKIMFITMSGKVLL